jgi:hypothetical protein
MMDTVDDPTKVLDENFIMNMFLKNVDTNPTVQGILGSLV